MAIVLPLVVLVSLAVLAPFPGWSSAAAPPRLRAPLAAAGTTATGSWAITAVGHLGDPLNTFWELFFLAPGAAHWSLVTPPGVADNGGLVAGASTSGTLTVGFEPSQLLRYSPLAQSGDGGIQWAPALLPTSLAATPDALAYEPAAPGTPGGALALTRSGRVLAGAASLGAWSPIATAGTLDSIASRSCGVDALDAVALAAGDVPLVGAGCRRGGQVGVFTRAGGSWRVTGPVLAGPLSGSATRVLRLQAAGSVTTGLVEGRTARRTALVVIGRTSAGSWAVSAPLLLGERETLLATAATAGGEQAVLLGSPRGRHVLEVGSPKGPWVRLPAPPAATTTLAALADGSIDAFSVHGSAVRVLRLAPGARTWGLLQSTVVPVAYGSS